MRFRFVVYLLIASISVAGISWLKYYTPHQGFGLTEKDCIEIYANLEKYSGLPGVLPPLTVADTPMVNAWMTPDGMTVTTGMLNFLHNKDELAAVIGHEIGHFVLQHFELGGDSRIHEANADKFGAFIMMRAGYDPCAIEGLWDRMTDQFGDQILTDSHPGSAQRAYEMKFPMCHRLIFASYNI